LGWCAAPQIEHCVPVDVVEGYGEGLVQDSGVFGAGTPGGVVASGGDA
jgi:hypothetical protein